MSAYTAVSQETIITETLKVWSISNQRQILMDYVREKGWTLIDCYVDDGFSGTNFDRPDFKRMIRDAERGRIDCIITKDLSRLGRNYIQTGYYTDEYFVENDIRFIAVNDGIDTMKDNNDIAAFHHVLNEFYPRQVSKKVRQVKKRALNRANSWEVKRLTVTKSLRRISMCLS